MEILITFLGTLALSILTAWLTEPLRDAIGDAFFRIGNFFDKDAFDLSGKWEAEFTESDTEGKGKVSTKEIIDFKQYGRVLKGESKIKDHEKRSFIYKCRIFHNTVAGNYEVKEKKKGSTSGSGTLLLKIEDTREEMNGRCVWIDRDSKEIEESSYSAKKL